MLKYIAVELNASKIIIMNSNIRDICSFKFILVLTLELLKGTRLTN